MKNYEVTIRYNTNQYFICTVKGKKGFIEKAKIIMNGEFVNLPHINEVWCDGETKEKENTIILK
jgi:hypothetical protein